MPPTAESEEPDVVLTEALTEASLGCDSFPPGPPGVRDAARAAFAWRMSETELAELTHDSLLDTLHLVAVDARGPRRVRFECADLTVEIEVHDGGGRRRLTGQILPSQPSRLTIRHPSGTQDAETDAQGRFELPRCPLGPVSLLCRLRADADERVVETEWVML